MTPGPFYAAKPYACAVLGLVGMATGNRIGIVCGLLLIALAGYIVWMRRNFD